MDQVPSLRHCIAYLVALLWFLFLVLTLIFIIIVDDVYITDQGEKRSGCIIVSKLFALLLNVSFLLILFKQCIFQVLYGMYILRLNPNISNHYPCICCKFIFMFIFKMAAICFQKILCNNLCHHLHFLSLPCKRIAQHAAVTPCWKSALSAPELLDLTVWLVLTQVTHLLRSFFTFHCVFMLLCPVS